MSKGLKEGLISALRMEPQTGRSQDKGLEDQTELLVLGEFSYKF